jgi:hypothetical protein
MDKESCLANEFEWGALNRVQIEMKVVWPVRVIASRIPRVEIDATEIHNPEERRQIMDDGKLDDVAGGMGDRTYIEPVRSRHWSAFLKEELATGAIRISLHDHGAILQVREKIGRSLGIIA